MTIEHTVGRAGRLGRVELVAMARRFALERGTSLENMVNDVLWALYQRAIAGHLDSAQAFLDLTTKEAVEMRAKSSRSSTAP